MKIKIAVVAIVGLLWIGAFHSALRAQQASRSVWDGVYTEEQAKRGAALFSQYCAQCHGTELQGGEEAPSLAGGAFTANWNGLTVGDLSERVRVTMPPDNPNRINRQQNVDILSHVLRANGFPAGQTELEARTEVLKQIRIEPKP